MPRQYSNRLLTLSQNTDVADCFFVQWIHHVPSSGVLWLCYYWRYFLNKKASPNGKGIEQKRRGLHAKNTKIWVLYFLLKKKISRNLKLKWKLFLSRGSFSVIFSGWESVRWETVWVGNCLGGEVSGGNLSGGELLLCCSVALLTCHLLNCRFINLSIQWP